MGNLVENLKLKKQTSFLAKKLTAHNFFISDEKLEQSPLNLEGFVLILTMETVSFTLTPSVLLPKMGFFNFQFDNNRLVLALGK